MQHKRIYLFILYISVSTITFAQKDLGSWNILNIKQDISKNLSAFAEAQIRSLSFYSKFHYYEYKAGLQYKINPTSTISFGVGNFDTYQGGGNFKTPMNNDETRTWLQFGLVNKIVKATIEHRYRAEQRFTTNGYRNRFRYRINVQHPFKIDKGEVAIFASNELFFTNNAPYFERNRFSLGLQKKWSSQFTTQVAFLNQFDYKINDEIGRNFFQISILLNNLFTIKKEATKQNNIIQHVDE
jgi:hypothetical protein